MASGTPSSNGGRRARAPWLAPAILAVTSAAILAVANSRLSRLPDDTEWLRALPGGVDSAVAVSGILLVAIPSFFALIALFRSLRPLPGRHRTAAAPLAVAQSAGGVPGDTGWRKRSRFDHNSEVLGINYGLLRRMEWRRFEIVCAEYLRCLGYEILETGFGDKDAVDLEVYAAGRRELFSVVKCRTDAEPVDVDGVREFVDTMKRRGVGEGMLFSVCGFTARAAKLATARRLALVSGEALCAYIEGFEPELRSAMLEVATRGDYTTPTCPSCGVKLVLRRKARSRPGQGEFWGCMNHPRCTVTRPLH